MKPRQLLYKLLFLLAALAGQHEGYGQAVKTYINRNKILIGEQIRFEIKVNLGASNYRVDFGIPDSIPHFDIIDQGKYDTTAEGVYTMRQTILFTSFDSGTWKFPSFPVTISAPGQGSKAFYSDSVIIQVGYSPSDSTDALRDIKPVMQVFVVDRTWIYYAVGALIALILAYLIYRYFKNRKKKAPPLFNTKLTAYEEAVKGLNQLAQSGAEPKVFYSTLSDIFKRYYSRKVNGNLMPETTGDLLVKLKEHSRSSEIVSSAAEVLRFADAVKFAKFRPSEAENNQAIIVMKSVIDHLEKKSFV
ncbi:MAG: hypothetical protein EOO06_03095 [Chitinophagaceae bacterium]|nr:MAG: hypothetical protein EOO06_03095 [Chitinophagaceae bacterium]